MNNPIIFSSPIPSKKSISNYYKPNMSTSSRYGQYSLGRSPYIKKDEGDVQEAETYDLTYVPYSTKIKKETISFSNKNINKLFHFLDKNAQLSLPIFLWLDTFHDFKYERLKGKIKKDGKNISEEDNEEDINIDEEYEEQKTSKKRKNEDVILFDDTKNFNKLKRDFINLYRNSFFNRNVLDLNECFDKDIDFEENIKFTVLKPLWYLELNKRKSIACLLYNLSLMIVNKNFEKILLYSYINYFFFSNSFKVDDRKVNEYCQFDQREYINNLKKILNSSETFMLDDNEGYIRDVEDRHIKDFIKGGKLLTIPASLFDKNPKNSTKNKDLIANISKTTIPFVNGYGFKNDNEKSEIVYEYTKKDCLLKVSIPKLDNYDNFFSKCSISSEDKGTYNMGWSVFEIFSIIYDKYYKNNINDNISCDILDWWVSLKRVGDYGQILQAKQLKIPLSTSDNMQILLSIVSCSSVIWKPTNKILYYDGKIDAFRTWDTDDLKYIQKRMREVSSINCIPVINNTYKDEIDKMLLIDYNPNEKNNYISGSSYIIKNTVSTFEENVDLVEYYGKNHLMIVPKENTNRYDEKGIFISDFFSNECLEGQHRIRSDCINNVYGYFGPDEKKQYKYIVEWKDVNFDKNPNSYQCISSSKKLSSTQKTVFLIQTCIVSINNNIDPKLLKTRKQIIDMKDSGGLSIIHNLNIYYENHKLNNEDKILLKFEDEDSLNKFQCRLKKYLEFIGIEKKSKEIPKDTKDKIIMQNFEEKENQLYYDIFTVGYYSTNNDENEISTIYQDKLIPIGKKLFEIGNNTYIYSIIANGVGYKTEGNGKMKSSVWKDLQKYYSELDDDKKECINNLLNNWNNIEQNKQNKQYIIEMVKNKYSFTTDEDIEKDIKNFEEQNKELIPSYPKRFSFKDCEVSIRTSDKEIYKNIGIPEQQNKEMQDEEEEMQDEEENKEMLYEKGLTFGKLFKYALDNNRLNNIQDFSNKYEFWRSASNKNKYPSMQASNVVTDLQKAFNSSSDSKFKDTISEDYNKDEKVVLKEILEEMYKEPESKTRSAKKPRNQKISKRKKGYLTLNKGYKKSRGRKIKRYPSSKN